MDKDLKKPDYMVPASGEERNMLRKLIAHFIDRSGLVPPVSRRQLTNLSLQLIGEEGLHPGLSGWLMVEMNNRLWRDTFSTVPYDRRILLLPKCLRNSSLCTAEIDEWGLVCRKCGHCSIALLEKKAEKLGMTSLVAEGITAVSELVELYQNGEIDAVIGVGCLDSLEKTFPLFVDNAVPGVAIALNGAGCKDMEVDTDYVINLVETWHAAPQQTNSAGFISATTGTDSLHSVCADLQSYPARITSLRDYERLKTEINQWFTPDYLVGLLGNTSDHSSLIAREWLCGEGKRWRPYLLVSAFMAITGRDTIPETVKKAAIAVEIFHKASLIHDDIQDNDDLRYGKPTVNALYGIPIAINAGDMLLGEGYRLLSECGMTGLVKEVASAHIALCRGQGIELEWCRNPRPITMKEVIHIFETKTVPAFGVALSLAVICAGGDGTLKAIMEKYAYAFGIAYQLLDDLDDFQSPTNVRLRPTSALAAICEDCDDRDFIETLLLQEDISVLMNDSKPLLEQAMARVAALAETYKQQALDSLAPLKNVELKRLLFRITKKILK